jgi:hypothetical protein
MLINLKLIRNLLMALDHFRGAAADRQMPQVLPRASLIYPFSPQAIPHEFFALQKSVSIAVSSTMWLSPVAQLLKIPLL